MRQSVMMQKSIKLCVQKATLCTLQYVQHPLHHEYKFSTRLLLKKTLMYKPFHIYLYNYSTKAYLPPPPPPISVVGIFNFYGLNGPGFKPR